MKVGITGAGSTWGDLDCLPLLSFLYFGFSVVAADA